MAGLVAVALVATGCATAPLAISGPQITLPALPAGQSVPSPSGSVLATTVTKGAAVAKAKATTAPAPGQQSQWGGPGGTARSSTPKTSSAAPRTVPVKTPARPPVATTVPAGPTDPSDPAAPTSPTTSPAPDPLCGAPANPDGYNFCGQGNLLTGLVGDAACALLDPTCLADLSIGLSYLVECVDGAFSMTGGTTNCADDGGVYEVVYDGT